MNKKVLIASLLAIALVLNATAFEAWAYGGCKQKKGLGDKFFCKAHMILKKKEELGLSDKQVKKIKDLKIKTKKDLIRKKAEIDIIALDIKVAMHGEKINTATVNKLIDRKYNLKKEKAKSLVGAYAMLKGMLTSGQKDKLKAIWKKCKKQKAHGSKEGKKACPMKWH
jgi:hypothetical protein